MNDLPKDKFCCNVCDKQLKRVHSMSADMQVNTYSTMHAMGIILRITEVMLQDISRDEVCQKIVDIIVEETGFENSSILLYDPSSDKLKLQAASNAAKIYKGITVNNFNRELEFEREFGLAWEVFESQVPIFISDSSKEKIPEVEGAKIKPIALACLPLASEGVLNISNGVPFKFTTRTKRDLVILASVIGNILLCSGKGDKLHASHNQLQNMVAAKTVEFNRINRDLQESINYMEAIIENTPQGICLLDHFGTVRNVNRSLLRDLGCEPSYLVGQSIKKLFKDPDHYMRFRTALEAGSMLRLSDIPIVRQNGTSIAADLYMHPIRHSQSDTWNAMVVIHDITAQKQASRQMAYVEKLRALGTMAGGIAHDFNNLLATINGNAELLALEIEDEVQLARLNNIIVAVADGAHSVKRLQAFTGFGAEERYHTILKSDIDKAVSEVIDLTRPMWFDELNPRGINIQIQKEIPPLPPAAIHECDLREILTNLVFNAVEAMPSGGTITFRAKQVDESIQLSVSDTGIGMPESIKNRIFDPYYSTKDVSNSGLGLSVCMGLLSQAGGTITVESEQGKGTTFIINLPLAEHEVQESKQTKESDVSHLKILAVDDEAQIIELLTLMLKEAGHDVIGCTEPLDALELIAKEDLDLVLTDLGMPGISGWEIAKKAKDREVPVILLTGWGAQYEDRELTEKGVSAVVSKPFRLSELTQIIQQATNS